MVPKKYTDSEFLEFMWPMRHYLVSCGDLQARSNVIAISFCMPVSKNPPMICCAIGREAYSASLIESSGEFIVNVPTEDLRKEIYFCGYHSGKDMDKFAETGLTKLAARKLRAPAIAECVAFMECSLRQVVPAGDKLLFIGEVVDAYADERLAKGELQPDLASGKFPRKIYGNRFSPGP